MSQLEQSADPVQGFSDAGNLGQVFTAKALHKLHGFLYQMAVGLRQSAFNDGDLACQRRVIEVVVQAASAQCVGQLSCAVAGEYHLRNVGGAKRTDFGHGNLVVGQHFEQKSFKGFVGAVDLIDQQHARASLADGAQQGSL